MDVFTTGSTGLAGKVARVGSVGIVGIVMLLGVLGTSATVTSATVTSATVTSATVTSATVTSAETGALADKRYERHLFAKGLNRPEAVVPLSDNSVLVAERSGRILLLDGSKRSDLGTITVPGMHIFYVANHPATEGLKDLISVPGQTGVFLWSITTGSAQAIRWTVGRARIEWKPGQMPTMKNEIIWQSEPQPWTQGAVPNFSGSRMVVDGADIVVAMGANSRAKGSGRIMRISMSGTHAPQLISTGHRNPGGVLIKSGVLWEVEHGPKGGDELNIIVPGGDYGWPIVSQGQPDDKNHRSFTKSRPDSIDPVSVWTPSIAPSSIAEWRGKFYIGALKAEAVIELTMSGNKVISQQRIFELGKRIRDVRTGVDAHKLWVLTDGPDAELFQVVGNSPVRGR